MACTVTSPVLAVKNTFLEVQEQEGPMTLCRTRSDPVYSMGRLPHLDGDEGCGTSCCKIKSETVAQILAAVASLYVDKLRPRGNVLKKRLAEQSGLPVDIQELRSVCLSIPHFYLQHEDVDEFMLQKAEENVDDIFTLSEEGSDWFVLDRNRQSCFQDMRASKGEMPEHDRQFLWKDVQKAGSHSNASTRESSADRTSDADSSFSGSWSTLSQTEPASRHGDITFGCFAGILPASPTFYQPACLMAPCVVSFPVVCHAAHPFPAWQPLPSSTPEQPLLADGDYARRIQMLAKILTSREFKLKQWDDERRKCILKLGQFPEDFPSLQLPKLPDAGKKPLETWDLKSQMDWDEFQRCWTEFKMKYRQCRNQWEELRRLGYVSSELPQLQLPSLAADGQTSKSSFQEANNRIRAWMKHGNEPVISWRKL